MLTGVLAAASAALACDASYSTVRATPAISPSAPYHQTPDTKHQTPTAATATPAVCDEGGVFCADPSAMERARVLDIIDGDTLDVETDGREERVRIFGIDTAERGERCYAEASSRLADLAAREVRLAADARDRDRNGRLLRYVYTPAGLSIDAALVAEGLAYAWTRDGALRDALVSLEAVARMAGRGCLWRD
jgi:micrococcal nuclease